MDLPLPPSVSLQPPFPLLSTCFSLSGTSLAKAAPPAAERSSQRPPPVSIPPRSPPSPGRSCWLQAACAAEELSGTSPRAQHRISWSAVAFPGPVGRLRVRAAARGGWLLDACSPSTVVVGEREECRSWAFIPRHCYFQTLGPSVGEMSSSSRTGSSPPAFILTGIPGVPVSSFWAARPLCCLSLLCSWRAAPCSAW